MAKSRIFIVLFSSIVLIKAANLDQSSKSQLPQSPTGDSNAALSCVLFGNQACNVECAITFQPFGFKSTGSCLKDQSCLCRSPGKTPKTLFNQWKEKFDAEYVYNQIIRNDAIAREVEQIMNQQNSTGEELKRKLRPLLSPYQYSQIKTKYNDPVSEFIRDGVVDEKAVQKYVSKQLDKFCSKDRSWLNIDYRNRFRQILENTRDRGTLYNYAYKVAQLGNKTLLYLLDNFLGHKGFETIEINLDVEPSAVVEVLQFSILNEFIKRNDNERKQIGDQKATAKRQVSTRLRSF